MSLLAQFSFWYKILHIQAHLGELQVQPTQTIVVPHDLVVYFILASSATSGEENVLDPLANHSQSLLKWY